MAEYLIMFNDEWVREHTADELATKGAASKAVVREMQDAGVLIFSNGGLDADTVVGTATKVDGKAVITDGPFVETKEHLGGFCAIDVPDDETARYWAGRLAEVLDWPQEVHRFRGAGMAATTASATDDLGQRA